MKQADWQTETTRIAAEIVQIEAEWKVFREDGNWDSARGAQDRFHDLRARQVTHVACEPAKAADGLDPRDVTPAQWRTERDWLSHEIDFIEIEWKGLRARGDWARAGIAQDRYHLLRKRQVTHVGRKPDKAG